MGQKVHPIGYRLGIVREHDAKWIMSKMEYAKTLVADLKVREYFQKKLSRAAAISKIQIERPAKNARIIIHSARPGVILGKKGSEAEALREEVSRLMGVPVHINIEEVRKPEVDATLVADAVAQQLEKRVMFRRAMKRAVTNALRQGAEGIKICVSGRLGGAEIARSEWYREGRVPLHTLRADIDYGFSEAHTTYGVIGVKVWVFKGEVIGERKQNLAEEQETEE